MRLTESELREIIGSVIKEALSRDVTRGAQQYINHKGGYTTNQRWDGLGGIARQAMGAKKDSNGQYDWQNSANEIEGYIRSYSNEIRRLTRVYNAITGHQVQGWSDERKAKASQTREFNKKWRADNNVTTGPNWANQQKGSLDGTKYAEASNRARDRRNDVAKNAMPSWMGSNRVNEDIDEGFLQNLFNRKNQPDEVEQICANYKQYIGNQDAAQKVMAKIEEYKGIVQKLKAIISRGRDMGHIVDTSAQNRSAMRAARNAQGGAYQYKQVAEAVERAFRKVLSESK